MTSMELLDLMGDIRGKYILEAHSEETASPKPVSPRRVLLIAAVIATALLLVGCTVAYVQGWFPQFFAQNSDAPLSDAQIDYISENEQLINESQTQNEWTVELRSAIQDGTTAYIIIGITAPEDVCLTRDPNNPYESFTPGNGGMTGGLAGAPDIVTASPGVVWNQLSFQWEEDGDGLDNTKNMVLQIYADLERSTTDPFGPEAEYYIHIENIVREYRDEAYHQELLNGKYKGQTEIMFTHEETVRLNRAEVLAEGIWDFTVTFPADPAADDGSQPIELLTQPMTTRANIFRKIGPGIEDYIDVDDDVTLISVLLRPLTLTLYYEDCNGGPTFTRTPEYPDRRVYAVMKDGSRIELQPYGGSGEGYVILEAQTPIVAAETDHILLSDGTKLPVPTPSAE